MSALIRGRKEARLAWISISEVGLDFVTPAFPILASESPSQRTFCGISAVDLRQLRASTWGGIRCRARHLLCPAELGNVSAVRVISLTHDC
jgi:hypothetical protein